VTRTADYQIVDNSYGGKSGQVEYFNGLPDLSQIERSIDMYHKVLDFGCGCGRVLSNLSEIPANRLYGTDIDQSAIDWCSANLPDIKWCVNDFWPPLPFADVSFDLIFAISVFTHLDEQYQHAWLSELHRIAMPGATLILSVHGAAFIKNLPLKYQNEIKHSGFMYITDATGWLKLDRLPDSYQAAYHTPEYIHRKWSDFFEIRKYVECGINNRQDAVILRKR
jgi:SAM-dependent methyltransferase